MVKYDCIYIYIHMCNNYNKTNICTILKAQPPICTLFAAFESHNLASVQLYISNTSIPNLAVTSKYTPKIAYALPIANLTHGLPYLLPMNYVVKGHLVIPAKSQILLYMLGRSLYLQIHRYMIYNDIHIYIYKSPIYIHIYRAQKIYTIYYIHI